MMMENYRSTPEILAAANALIDKNKYRIPKALIPTLPSGAPVLCHLGETQAAEAQWIAGEMEQLHSQGVPYRDMTVLYRAHYVSRAVEEALLQAKIPYTIYSGVQFFGRMEIKDALSYLRMMVYKDDMSFRRIANVPKRNLGKRRMAFLEAYAAEHGKTLYQSLLDNLEDPVFKGTKAQAFVSLIEAFAAGYEGRPISEVLSAVLNESGYEKMLRTEGSQERLDNLAELKQSVYEYETTCGEETTLEHYLAHIALFSNSDAGDQGDKVKLMSVHAAKGLEFPYVFLCGMNEGIFPSRKVRTLQGMEEERRLAFVALTRAEKGLCLSEADGRNFDGSPRYPSRFLLDIDQELLTYTRPPEEGLIREARYAIASSERYMPQDDSAITFSVGQRVRHQMFGPGTVVEVDMERGAHVVQFDGVATPRRISFRARLEKM
uniref:ATP-dependent helicase n=1 Tax=uncultured Pseudoflavonifractor sp. TaxID=1221379 RepID=UPI0025D0C102